MGRSPEVILQSGHLRSRQTSFHSCDKFVIEGRNTARQSGAMRELVTGDGPEELLNEGRVNKVERNLLRNKHTEKENVKVLLRDQVGCTLGKVGGNGTRTSSPLCNTG